MVLPSIKAGNWKVSDLPPPVGNIYKKVKDPNLVSALSGHKEGSKAFRRYRDIDEEMKKDLVKLLD